MMGTDTASIPTIESNRIYNIDCMDGMELIPDKSIDMIFSDLPFGTTNCDWDVPLDLEQLWPEYKRIIKDHGAIVLFAQTPFDKILGCSNIEMLRYEWIWEKTSATGHMNAKKMPMKAHENILVFYKKLPIFHPQKTSGHPPVHSSVSRIDSQNRCELYGNCKKETKNGGATTRYPRSVLTFSKDVQTSHLHPTQKPLDLCRYMIRSYTNPGDLVLDNCCGSGTIPLAAKIEGRSYIGMDNGMCSKSGRSWVEIAEERIISDYTLITKDSQQKKNTGNEILPGQMNFDEIE